MKGKLKKLSTGWVVEYKMESDMVATDGGQIPINPYLEKYYFLDEDDEGSEVYFEMESLWETGFEEEVLIVANLVKETKESWEDIEEEYSKDNYPPFGGPFTDALDVWEWLKINYHPPVRKKTF